MSGTQPFQFEPTYPPGEEPIYSEEESQEEESSQSHNENWEYRMVHLWGKLRKHVYCRRMYT